MVSFLRFAGGRDPQPKTSNIKVLASKSLKSKKFGAAARFLDSAARGVGGRGLHLPLALATGTWHWRSPAALYTAPPRQQEHSHMTRRAGERNLLLSYLVE